MRMMVRCGDEDCASEFFVESKEPVWTCEKCGREITNRYYPFLTAKLMQAKIDGDAANWKEMYAELLDTARTEIAARGVRAEDVAFLEEAGSLMERKRAMSNQEWRAEHDQLLERARTYILSVE
ncbi:MAG: hypothetical protein JXA22_10630 [Candidatus Thermoplasmatota archaeon]|nr:hypothetical protein [Candidatus Thermoplasmatota archaeon]